MFDFTTAWGKLHLCIPQNYVYGLWLNRIRPFHCFAVVGWANAIRPYMRSGISIPNNSIPDVNTDNVFVDNAALNAFAASLSALMTDCPLL